MIDTTNQSAAACKPGCDCKTCAERAHEQAEREDWKLRIDAQAEIRRRLAERKGEPAK